MYQGKFNSQKFFHRRYIVLMVSVGLLLTLAISGTIAYLLMGTDGIVNTFQPTSVPNKVVEEYNGTVKNNVKIQNISEDVPAYIRAEVVVTWVSTTENSQVAGKMPVEGTDYQITWTKDGWVQGADGFFYYTSPVEPGKETGILFTECKLESNVTPPSGYALAVEILGESIQAVGQDAQGNKPVILAWGNANGGSVTSVGENGNLEVTTAATVEGG